MGPNTRHPRCSIAMAATCHLLALLTIRCRQLRAPHPISQHGATPASTPILLLEHASLSAATSGEPFEASVCIAGWV